MKNENVAKVVEQVQKNIISVGDGMLALFFLMAEGKCNHIEVMQGEKMICEFGEGKYLGI